jgi:hypothetical protein
MCDFIPRLIDRFQDMKNPPENVYLTTKEGNILEVPFERIHSRRCKQPLFYYRRHFEDAKGSSKEFVSSLKGSLAPLAMTSLLVGR